MSQSSHKEFKKLVETGLAQVDDEHQFLIEAFVEVLSDIGEREAAAAVAGNMRGIDDTNLNDQTVQAISFSFQLLNLAE